MNRSTSPLHVHIARNTPLHVHVKSTGKKKGATEANLKRNRRLEQSFAEMAAGRPSLRASSALNASRRMRASDWVKSSCSQGPWVPPPAKTSRPKMTWEGPTHRLEITPGDDTNNNTVLRMSDLASDDSSAATTDIVMEPQGSGDKLDKKLKSIMSEVDTLKNEVSLRRSLHDAELKQSQLALNRKESELENCRQALEDSKAEHAAIIHSMSQNRVNLSNESSRKELQSHREQLMKKLMEAELDSSTAAKQATSLKETLKKLETHLSSSMYATELGHQREALVQRLSEFNNTNRKLRTLLRDQQAKEEGLQQVNEQYELLLKCYKDTEETNKRLLQQVADRDKLYTDSRVIREESNKLENLNKSLQVKIQELDKELQLSRTECIELQRNIAESQLKWSREKDALKKATKQHKEQASRSDETVERLQSHLEDAKTQLHQLRGKMNKLGQVEMSASTLSLRVRELEEELEETKRSTKAALESVSNQLMEKTRELANVHLEREKLRASVSTTEEKLRGIESTAHMKESTAQVEIAQLQASVSQFEGLVSEYKTQLDKSRQDCDELSHQLKLQQRETERVRQESALDIEKLRVKMQHHLSDLDHLPEHLRDTEVRLRDAQQQLLEQEKKSMEQTKLISELATKSDYRSEEAGGLRDRVHTLTSEVATLKIQLSATEKRLEEADRHNRELINTASKKEDTILNLQSRVGELTHELSSVKKQSDTDNVDIKRQCERLKEQASTKEHSYSRRIAELEAQLSRANSSAVHLKRAKDEAERRSQSRVNDLKERLEQANNSSRSMQNYITFLKSSYSNVFNDSLTGYNPGTSSLSPLLH